MSSVFNSRRSAALGTHWGVSCDQPLASKIGADVLVSGGNAADAAVAMAAALCVTQPSSVSLGGDGFLLYYDTVTKNVSAYNGSGRSPSALTFDLLRSCGFDRDSPMPVDSPLSLTVPGMPGTLHDCHDIYGSGKCSLEDLLRPSIRLAEEGFPVSEISAMIWQDTKQALFKSQNGKELLMPNGKPPRTGDVIRLPEMARSFRILATEGKRGFYEGPFAEAMAASIADQGGILSAQDLSCHLSSPPDHLVEPLSVSYRGKRVWQLPPNCDGFVALIALNILEGYDLKGLGHNSAAYLHRVVESLRLAFSDGFQHNASRTTPQMAALLSKDYAGKRRALINSDKCLPIDLEGGLPLSGPGDTIYLSVIDDSGNACSFMATCCGRFGSTLIPKGCGFVVQNRCISMSYNPESPNAMGPSKRTFHTNMPGMVTDDVTGDVIASVGVMGYLAQPQGVLQVLLNMIDFNMDPQKALDQPRICLSPIYGPVIEMPFPEVHLEAGLDQDIAKDLRAKGHKLLVRETLRERCNFGRGHVVTRGGDWWKETKTCDHKGTLWVGTDPRSDGIAIAW